jgi:hypothetical protein
LPTRIERRSGTPLGERKIQQSPSAIGRSDQHLGGGDRPAGQPPSRHPQTVIGVTAEVVEDDGQPANIAVPAFAAEGTAGAAST